jgi:hypothetical protein
VLDLEPGSVRAWRELSSVLISMGRDAEGFDLQLSHCAALLREFARGEAAARRGIEGFERRARLGADEPFTRYYAAAAHALKGDADTAIAFLERAAAARRTFTVARARIEPEFEALRGDARFQRLVGETAAQR